MASATEVSVVLPAYNEEATIERTVDTTLKTLSSFLPDGSYEVVITEDGCDDRTPEIAERLADEDDRVRHLHSDDRLGRGGALERAFRATEGGTFVYFDTDLATDMRHLEELVESVRSGGYDIATGSRLVPGRRARRPSKRAVASRGFNTLVRLLLRSDLRDHQCGFKAFDRAALESLVDDVEDDHWFWDTEVLVRAQRAGLRVKEFPVDWEPKGDSKVDIVRDVAGMGSGVVRTWWQLSVAPRITPRVSVLGGLALTVAALGLMFAYLDPRAVLAELRRVDPLFIGLAAAVYLISWPVRGARYRTILEELGYRGSLGVLTGAVFISQTGNLVFPARVGDAVRAYVVKARRGVPYATGFASLAVERVFDLLTLAALAASVLFGLAASGETAAIVGTVAGAGRPGRTAVLVASGVGLAAVAITAVIVLGARSERGHARAFVSRISTDAYADRVAAVVERFAGDVHRGVGSRVAFARVGVNSLVIWTLDVVTALLVLYALGVEIPLPTLFTVGVLAVSVGNLAKVLPLSPGGIGLYEAAFTLLVVGLSPVAGSVAFSAALLDHAVKNAVTVAGGLASMVLLNVSLTTALDERPEGRTRETSRSLRGK